MIRTAGNSCSGRLPKFQQVKPISQARGSPEDNRNGIQELNSLHELVILRQIDDDDRLDIRAVGHVSHDTESGEQGRDKDHASAQDARELLGFFHGFSDGDESVQSTR